MKKSKVEAVKHESPIEIMEDAIKRLEACSNGIGSSGIHPHDQNKEMAILDELLPRMQHLLKSAKRLDSTYDIAASTAKK